MARPTSTSSATTDKPGSSYPFSLGPPQHIIMSLILPPNVTNPMLLLTIQHKDQAVEDTRDQVAVKKIVFVLQPTGLELNSAKNFLHHQLHQQAVLPLHIHQLYQKVVLLLRRHLQQEVVQVLPALRQLQQ